MFEVSLRVKILFTTFVAASYVMLYFVYLHLPDNAFHIAFLNVGQGDSIFIKTPENHQILIDGGPKNTIMEELDDVMPFFDKSLDMVVLTHPQADHLNGLIEIFKRYKIDNVLLTGVNYDSFYYDEFLDELLANEVEIFMANEKTDFSVGDVLIDVIYPFEQLVLDDFKEVNNSSVVILVSYKNKHILLTGDLEEKIEKELVERVNLSHVDILKVGHHGSKSSSSIEFLQKVTPDVAVIQVGKNSFGHPTDEVMQRLKDVGVKRIYRNDLDGRVEFVF